MNDIALHTGADIIFEEDFRISQPTIFEISEIFAESEFFKAIQLLCIEKQENVSSLQVLLSMLLGKMMTNEDKSLIIKMLHLLLKKNLPYINDQGLFLKSNQENIDNLILTEENFEDFQTIIRKIFAFDKLFSDKQKDDFNPVGDKAAEIAAKLRKRHETLAKIKAKENENKSFFGNYLSIVSVGLGENMTDLSHKLTLFQLLKELERIGFREGFNQLLKIKTSFVTAGSSKEPLEDWMRFI